MNCGTNITVPACSTQAQVNVAWITFLASTTASGGCNGALTNNATTAPSACGGSANVAWTYTAGCGQTQSCTRTFTVAATPAVIFNCGNDVTVAACSTQAQVDSAWTAFLASTTASGGCAVGTLTNNATSAPSACGGYKDVTWTYNANNPCEQPSDCEGQFKTFTIGGWGTDCNGNNPGCYRDANFDIAFPDGLAIGCGNNKLTFTSSSAIASYLPAGGSSALLSGNVVNPVGSRGVLSSQLIALTLSVGFDVSNPNFSSSNSSLGSLTINSGTFAGMTVANFLQLANNIIGGCSNQYSLSAINEAATAINENFDNGTVDNHFLNCGGQTTQGGTNTYTCTKRFTVTATPAVVFNCGSDVTVPACSTQAQVNAAWTAFIASTTASGGCGGVLTNNCPATTGPDKCGGYRDVTWTYTVGSCGQTQSCTRRFTVLAPAAVVINCGSNVTVPACSTQAQVNAAWTAFLSSTTASGGCNGVLTTNCTTPPNKCGGYRDVTWTYTVSGCGTTSGCNSNNQVTCTKRFTVLAPPAVVMNCATNICLPACSTQAQLNAAWSAFLASTTATGGCGGVLTNNATTAPSLCGGYKDVTWTYTVGSCGTTTSGCGSTSNGQVTCTKRFTVTAAPAVVFNCGNNVTVPACSTQAQVNAAWNSFLASTTASGGCGGVLANNATSAPSACGGYKDVTWTYNVSTVCGTPTGCNSNGQLTCTKRFTILAAPAVVMNCGNNVTLPACSTQAQVNAAWNSFLASTTATGGCNGVLTRSTSTAPSSCGGYKDVTWTYTVSNACGTVPAGCNSNGQVTCTKRFTVLAAPAVVMNCGNNVTMPACSTQAQINAAWTAFLCSTTATGGCNGVLIRTSATAPSSCGGYKDVTWTYTVSNACGTVPAGCNSNGQVTCTKRFTVLAPPAVVFNCGNDVTVSTCLTQSQVNAAWASFLCSTTANGGCGGVMTNNAPSCAPAANRCGYVDVTWTYTVNNACGTTSGCNSNGQVTCTKRFRIATSGYTKGTNEIRTDVATDERPEIAAFDARVYPNPFTESFNLNLTTSSQDVVELVVYDMTGKLIEKLQVNPMEVTELHVGDRYSSGVYNVIVTQGNEIKTLRVIKR